ncbi:MAG: molecular chaperone DnaK [Candidatus Dojkabacteria bacterium]|nr:molecular chaperone DnaK [Candidatus Dojkabacteria bacterium]
MAKVVGIDLGTTNSVVSFVQGGRPEVITSKEGRRIIPSVVAIDPISKAVVVGDIAKNQMVTNPKQTFYSIKRLIGRRFSDPEVQRDIKILPFEIRESSKGGVEILFGDKWVAPEVISAKVLSKIKADAEAYLGEPVNEAVITVPAYFDDSQRQATKNAGEIAGLKVLRIINEPTAAAIAYGFDKKQDQTIVVYDLGGGTFDVSILEIGDGVYEVKSTSGDTHLGGDDFDQRLIDYFVSNFLNEQGINLKDDPTALQRLKDAAEKAKIILSTSESTEVNLPYITADAKGPKHFRMMITRAELEKMVMDLVDKTFISVDKALKDANLSVSDIDEVIMVGGMTRMPLVQRKVEEYFGKKPNLSVNPDEVVSIGAAIQAAVLSGDTSVQDITLLDVTPLSLGIKVNMGEMHVMIPRNTTIPTEVTGDNFTTGTDGQTAIEIEVYQGERPMAKDNKLLGTFVLDGIPPAPRGVPRFAITFKIDANGILTVKAKDLGTQKEKSITIKASTQLDQSEIERHVKEAAENAARDKQVVERLRKMNEAESLSYQVEKLIKDHGSKIDEDSKQKLEKAKSDVQIALQQVKQAGELEQEPVKNLDNKIKELQEILQTVGAKIYQNTDTNTDNMPGSTGSSGLEGENPTASEGEVIEPDKPN